MPEIDVAEFLAREDVARTALSEIAPPKSVGALRGHVVEGEEVVSLQFESLMPGYPGWLWTVTMAKATPEDAPTVLEAELLPGDGALTAPPWRPWAERFAEYQATHSDDEGDESGDADAEASEQNTDDSSIDEEDPGEAVPEAVEEIVDEVEVEEEAETEPVTESVSAGDASTDDAPAGLSDASADDNQSDETGEQVTETQ